MSASLAANLGLDASHHALIAANIIQISMIRSASSSDRLPDATFLFLTTWLAANELRFVANRPGFAMGAIAIRSFEEKAVHTAAASIARD